MTKLISIYSCYSCEKVTEPFIVPSLYEKYANGSGGTAVDEYTLSQNMGSDLASVMEDHYKTFIVSTKELILGTQLADLNPYRMIADGTRLYGHCGCWFELGQDTVW